MRDNKNILLILLVLSFLLSLLTIFVVAEGGVPSVSAKASALYEPETGEFVYEKNADTRLPMASTTKIMTALIAIEKCDLTEVVTVPREATGIEGSSIYLKEGDEITVRDLVYSVLLQSANDAATALAIKISGDVKGFADVMNDRAAELGLKNTSFQNPHGLDAEGHFTSARDLAILAAVALRNNTFRDICSTYKHSFRVSDAQRTIVNHNKLLKRYDGAIGVKTGYTDESGRCLVSAAENGGVTLVAVTLNAPDDWSDHTRMLDYGFTLFEALPLSSITELDFSLPVRGGQIDSFSATVSCGDVSVVRRKDSAELTANSIINEDITAPIRIGDTVGTFNVYEGDILRFSCEIIACEDVSELEERGGIFDFIKKLF